MSLEANAMTRLRARHAEMHAILSRADFARSEIESYTEALIGSLEELHRGIGDSVRRKVERRRERLAL